jgi:ketosteroid isomerase-like protein
MVAHMTTITPTFDAAALRRGIEARDASALVDLYAEDAVIERVDARNPPSAPARLAGRDAIRGALEDVYARDMTHRVESVAVGADAVGYTVRCSYPDGTRVVCAAVAELRDGRIVREVGVQAWDS